jgi:hypothetical protein
VHFDDGSSHEFLRRERPHLVLGKNKVGHVKLIALSNGASPQWKKADPNEMCFTLMQPIRSTENPIT